jgi:hypothetical protein
LNAYVELRFSVPGDIEATQNDADAMQLIKGAMEGGAMGSL